MSRERVRELNDAFRTTFKGGRVVITAGVDALPPAAKAMVIRMVATFTEFTEDNDPYSEHDFGSLKLAGRTFFWKIDLYEPSDVKGEVSEDGYARVLTILLAEEY